MRRAEQSSRVARPGYPGRAFLPPRGRAGFSLTEVLVALAITAIMTTIIIVQTAPGVPATRGATLRTSLRSLGDAASKFRSPQSGTANQWPKYLKYLSTHPKRYKATETVVDVCGNTLRYAYTEDSLHWRGPYVLMNTEGGVRVDQMMISDTLTREPAQPPVSDPNEEGNLVFTVRHVDQAVAEALETAHEGQKYNLAADEVRWTADSPGNRRGTLTYRIRISGC